MIALLSFFPVLGCPFHLGVLVWDVCVGCFCCFPSRFVFFRFSCFPFFSFLLVLRYYIVLGVIFPGWVSRSFFPFLFIVPFSSLLLVSERFPNILIRQEIHPPLFPLLFSPFPSFFIFSVLPLFPFRKNGGAPFRGGFSVVSFLSGRVGLGFCSSFGLEGGVDVARFGVDDSSLFFLVPSIFFPFLLITFLYNTQKDLVSPLRNDSP